MTTHTYGPVQLTGGHTVAADTIEIAFAITTHDVSGTVVVTTTDDTITAHLKAINAPDDVRDAASDAATVPLQLQRTGEAVRGALTLPTARLDGLAPGPATSAELQLAAPSHKAWIEKAGGTVEDDGDGRVLAYVGKPRPLVIAVIATRLYPVLTGHDFSAALPWDVPPRRGNRSGTVHGGGGGGGGNGTTLVSQMELYDKLLDALEAATTAAGPKVEYGIVEHYFAALYPDDYRTLHRRMGHISVDHPMKSSLSGYLAQLLGRLSGRGEIEYWPSRGTGYWGYNSTISSWSWPGGAVAPTTSWADHVEKLGVSPWAWPAAHVLLGSEAPTATPEAFEFPDGRPLTHDNAPTDPHSEEARQLADAFDGHAYLAHANRDEPARVAANRAAGEWMPKDIPLLRAIVTLSDDDNLRADALQRIREVLK